MLLSYVFNKTVALYQYFDKEDRYISRKLYQNRLVKIDCENIDLCNKIWRDIFMLRGYHRFDHLFDREISQTNKNDFKINFKSSTLSA